jgi:dissimilatory sulfite reductase related protein
VENRNHVGDHRKNALWVDGHEIILDREGFLKNSSLWSDKVAAALAAEAGIEVLSDKQWQVIHFIRRYYTEQGKAPLNHKIKVGTGLSLTEIESLFPGGIAFGARRLAGMRNSKGCTGGG